MGSKDGGVVAHRAIEYVQGWDHARPLGCMGAVRVKGSVRGTLTQASDWRERLRSTGGMEVACRMSA